MKGRAWLVGHSEGQKRESHGLPLTRKWPSTNRGRPPHGRPCTERTSAGEGGPGGHRPSAGCSEALVDPPGLFSWPCLGLSGVLLGSARPAQAQLPTLRVSLAQHAAGRPGRHKRSVWLWWPRLPGVLEVLPQPGGQRLAHLVQQLGELDVVVPIIVLQEGAGLEQEEEFRPQGSAGSRGTSPLCKSTTVSVNPHTYHLFTTILKMAASEIK